MKKIIGYFFLFVFFTGTLAGYVSTKRELERKFQPVDNDVDQNTLNAKKHLIKFIDVGVGYVLGDKEKKEFSAYKINKYTGSQEYEVLSMRLDYVESEGYYSFPTNTYIDDLVYTDTLSSVHLDEIRTEIYDASHVAINFQEEVPSDASDEFIGQIDDGLFVFLFIALLVLMALLFLELPIYLIRRYLDRESRLWVYIGAISLLFVFVQTMMAPGLWPEVPIEIVVRPILLFLPAFAIYQWFSFKRFPRLDFLDEQLIKFVIIFFVGVVGMVLADKFSHYIACTEDRGVVISNKNLLLAMMYSFALGNLLCNLVRHGWSLRRSDQKLAIAKKEALTSESKLQSIQSSVNPHFLYNALNSISSLAVIDPERTQKMTMALSDFYRYHTNRDQQNLTSIREEVAMLEKYIEIEKIRFEDRIDYHTAIEIDGSAEIPHFLLQPLVENAIKHGYNSETNKIKVELKIWTSADQLFISVADSGKDFDLNINMGYGLRSVSQKLALLYPSKHELAFINEPHKHVLITIDRTI